MLNPGVFFFPLKDTEKFFKDISLITLSTSFLFNLRSSQ